MGHCPDCNEDHWDEVVGGHVACPGCGHEERIAALEAKLAEVQAEIAEWRTGAHADATGHLHRCAKVNGVWQCAAGCAVAERDALMVKLAEAQAEAVRLEARVARAQAELKTQTDSFSAALGSALRTVSKIEADRDALRAMLVRLSPTLANDPRPHTTEEQIAIVEQEYHALVEDHAETEATLEQAREAFRFISHGHTIPGHKGESEHPLIAIAQEVIHGAQSTARKALAALDTGKEVL